MAGNSYARLADRNTAQELPFIQADYRGFDDLRRKSVRGDVLARTLASILSERLAQQGGPSFHAAMASATSFRAGHVSVMLTSPGGPLPVSLVMRDGSGARTGHAGDAGKIVKLIPFSDLLPFTDGNGATIAQLGLVASPSGDYVIELHRAPAPRPMRGSR